MNDIVFVNGRFQRAIGIFYISMGKKELELEVNRMFNKRLEEVIREGEICIEDFIRGFSSAGIPQKIAVKLGEKTMSCKFKANEVHGITLYIIARVCNCSIDYLLGLSDCINPVG